MLQRMRTCQISGLGITGALLIYFRRRFDAMWVSDGSSRGAVEGAVNKLAWTWRTESNVERLVHPRFQERMAVK